MRKKGKFTSSDDLKKRRKKKQKPLAIAQQIGGTDDEITSEKVSKPQLHKSSIKDETNDNIKKKRKKKSEAQKKRERLEKLYNNQLTRINRLIKQETSKGFTQTDDILPLLNGNIDENIIEQLSQIRIADIRNAGMYFDEETGQMLPYNKWKYLQRKNEAQNIEARLEQRYNKQLDRINKMIEQEMGKGFMQTDDIIPLLTGSIDENIVEQLSQIRIDDIRKAGLYVDEETGDMLPYNKWKYLQEKRKKKAKNDSNDNTPSDEPYDEFASHIIAEFKTYLSHFPDQINIPIRDFIDKMVSLIGVTPVADSLQKIPESLWDVFERCGYDYDETVKEFTQLIIDWLPDIHGYDPKDFLDEDYLKEQIEMINNSYDLMYKKHEG